MIRFLAMIRGLLYAVGFVALWWWVIRSVRPLDARIPFSIPEWFWMPGFVIVVFGAAILLWCVGTFALVGKGTPAPFDAPREFVAAGPYLYVRNPMYLGAVIVIIGAALVLQSVSALLVAVVFILLAHAFVLHYEEPTLEERFGKGYLQYKTLVNRWLPRLPQ
jgi:protein-S-isoprenylcysteine O-methyltransferase Ste14